MSHIIVFIVVAMLIGRTPTIFRFRQNKRENERIVQQFISDLCQEMGVPDTPFDVRAAVQEVMVGKRFGVLRDGSWWTAQGVEVIGNSSQTRLLSEGTAPSIDAVHGRIEGLFREFGGNAELPPHLAEGRFLGSMPGTHSDIIYARITGRLRPIGAWMIAVPPWLIGGK